MAKTTQAQPPLWFLIYYTAQSTKAPITPTTEPMIASSMTRRDAPAVGGGACAFSGAEAHTGEGAGGEGAGGNADSGAGATADSGGVVGRRTAITIMYSF